MEWVAEGVDVAGFAVGIGEEGDFGRVVEE